MIDIGIVGGTDYTGSVLTRLLQNHPEVRITYATSLDTTLPPTDASRDQSFKSNKCEHTKPDIKRLCRCDLVFFATSHGISHKIAPKLFASGVNIIDLSSDFRLNDVSLWEKWYGQKHYAPMLINDAVYGLPEMNRDKIRNAQLVSVPGCFTTAISLGLMPLLENNMAKDGTLIANCVSGITGIGNEPEIDTLFTEVVDNFQEYGLHEHRQKPEIDQQISALRNRRTSITFIPHVSPITRGLYCSLYADVTKMNADFQSIYERRYTGEPFVNILPHTVPPKVSSVRGTNFCDISLRKEKHKNRLVIFVTVDNLIKGESGQAIQIMNIMYDLDEKRGLMEI